ncbi:MAG: hypothetical protein LBN04_01025 [Oscillospiraceae bacterium]|nr:hypothetical protein [Oscillospiraceae bacterium]
MTPAYGGRYNPDARNYTMLLGSGQTMVLPSTMPNSETTYTPDNAITVDEAGDYQICYNVDASASLATSVTVAARQNGSAIDSLSQNKTLNLSGDTAFANCSIVTLAAGDVIDLYMSSGLAATVTANNADLRVTKLN